MNAQYWSNHKKNKGQVIVAGMGLMAVSAVVFFMMFNSNRAVSEKINLVNAADAAAYSGALVASRQLNFMAYTNRTMIANEVAIGHMVSYQTEVNLVQDTFTTGLGGIGGGLLSTALNYFNVGAGLGVWQETMEVIGGAYVLAVDATNGMYSEFQKTEYKALMASGADSPIDNAMTGVAREYVKRNGITISINDSDTLDSIMAGSDVDLKAKAENATDKSLLCSMIMFARPGEDTNPGNSDENRRNENIAKGNSMNGFCKSNGNANPPGSVDKPFADSGDLMDMLNRSALNATSRDWVTNRGAAGAYTTLWSLGTNLTRTGSTEAVWDNANNQVNWSSSDLNDSSDLGDNIQGAQGPFGVLFSVNADGRNDAVSVGDAFANNTVSAVVATALTSLMDVLGVCDDGVDCDAIKNGQYNGIQSYARLNPTSTQATITAFLTQSKNCNDLLGVENDDVQEEVEKWNDDQTRFGSNCDERSLTALSEARIFYQRPRCVDINHNGSCDSGFAELESGESEMPNLFNPFWSASLANTSSFIN